jgi:hypothetical protein
MDYHHAAMQVIDEGPGRCRFVWITDMLPAAMVEAIRPLISQGAQALKKNLEAGAAPTTER